MQNHIRIEERSAGLSRKYGTISSAKYNTNIINGTLMIQYMFQNNQVIDLVYSMKPNVYKT